MVACLVLETLPCFKFGVQILASPSWNFCHNFVHSCAVLLQLFVFRLSGSLPEAFMLCFCLLLCICFHLRKLRTEKWRAKWIWLEDLWWYFQQAYMHTYNFFFRLYDKVSKTKQANMIKFLKQKLLQLHMTLLVWLHLIFRLYRWGRYVSFSILYFRL